MTPAAHRITVSVTQMGFCIELAEWAIEARGLLEMVGRGEFNFEAARGLAEECPIQETETL